MTENLDLEAMASNPHTDWDVLHWIAENHPELRPAVAGNPGTYQELVDALGMLGDPQIDEAIAQRAASGGVSATPEEQPEPVQEAGPVAEADPESQPEFESEAEPEPAGELEPEAGYAEAQSAEAQPEAVTGEESAEPEPEVETEPDSLAESDPEQASLLGGMWDTGSHGLTEPVPPTDDQAEAELAPYEEPHEPHPVPAPAAAAYSPVEFDEPAFPAEQSHPDEDDAADQTRPRFRDSAWVPVLACVGGLLAAVGVVGLIILSLGGDDDTPAAEPPPVSEPTATAPEEDEDEDTGGEDETGENGSEDEEPAEEEPQIDEEAIADTRAAVTDLTENPTCDIDDDAATVSAFVAAAGMDEAFPGDEDASLLESAFEEMQEECSTTHAAEVFEAARSGSHAPEDGQGEALTTVGTDWADRAVDLRGADVVSGFSAQDGNVVCEFDDGLTCTVYDTSPELCDEGATYRMTVDGVDVDCDAHLESSDAETLSEDDSATDGFLVCTEMSDRLSCYNSLEPFGFEVSSTGNYSY